MKQIEQHVEANEQGEAVWAVQLLSEESHYIVRYIYGSELELTVDHLFDVHKEATRYYNRVRNNPSIAV